MFNSQKTGKLPGIALAVMVFSGTLGLNLHGGSTAASVYSRTPGDAEPLETPAAAPAAPLTLREFASQEELAAWVKDAVTTFQQADKANPPTCQKLVPTSVWDCDDYAERLQRKALGEGYIVSIQLITGGTLLGARVTNYIEDHMANLTVIGNYMYYIEPMDGHVALIGPKD